MVPPGPSDRQAAWVGTWAEEPETTVRVEAAAYRGRPVWFHTQVGELAPEAKQSLREPPSWAWAFLLAVFTLATLLAVRNLRRGRGDGVTARRLALLLLVWLLLSAIVQGEYAGLKVGLPALTPSLGSAVFVSGIVALSYLALEPAVRRRWPWRLTAWTRLFAGRWRDPMVGRDVLVGMAAAAVVNSAFLAHDWIAAATGGSEFNRIITAQRLDIPPVSNGQLFAVLGIVMIAPVFQLFVSFCIFLVVRRERIAWPAFAALIFFANTVTLIPQLSGVILAVIVVRAAVTATAVAFLMARFGLLATAGWMLVTAMFSALPLTADTGAWYFPQAAVGIGVLVAVAGFCAWNATGSRRPSIGRLLGDE
jgi:serine/threonine-protein kinase